ncbi:UNVERIFIED_CONTAM: hypothetical protein FKN15_052822 [Acipenser sinensis]
MREMLVSELLRCIEQKWKGKQTNVILLMGVWRFQGALSYESSVEEMETEILLLSAAETFPELATRSSLKCNADSKHNHRKAQESFM